MQITFYANLFLLPKLYNNTGHPLVSIARICVSALVACCYPLSINPGRKVILAVMAHLDPDDIEISEKTLLLRFAVVTVSCQVH